MKKFAELTEELNGDVEAQGLEAVDYLNAELPKILPAFYKVKAMYNKGLEKSVSLLVVDARKESVKVTFHNSNNIVHLMMHLDDAGDLAKPSFGNIGSTSRHFKYRKVSGKSVMDASKKLVAWFKKNQKAFEEAPM